MKKSVFGLLLLAVFLFMFLLNYLYPIYADDWVYLMKMPENTPAHNFFDILQTQHLHYFNVGGRIIVHIIAQSQLLIGAPYNDIINSLAYITFICLIYLLSVESFNLRQLRPLLLIFISLLLWLLIPTYGVTILNITTSANYLWGTIIILSFIYPYCVYFKRDDVDDPISKWIVFLFLGIVAGWTNENMALAMIFMISVILISKKIQSQNISKWSISGLIGAIIGCAVMLIAPGNYARYEIEEERLSSGASYIQRIYNILGGIYDNALLILILFSVLFVLYIYIQKREKIDLRNDKILQLSILFLTTSIVATLAMIGSPIFPKRAWFGIVTFMIIGTTILYANIKFTGLLFKTANALLILFLSVCFIKQYYAYYYDLKYIHDITAKREIFLEEQIKRGIPDIVFEEPIYPKTKFTDISDFSSDSTFWLNVQFSKYNGIRTMRVEHTDTE